MKYFYIYYAVFIQHTYIYTPLILVHRTAESSVASWSQADWDGTYGALRLDWSMEKVSRSKLIFIFIFNDQTDNWKLDFDVALFEFWYTPASELGDEEGEKWMFPFLAKVQRPGDKVNSYIKRFLSPQQQDTSSIKNILNVATLTTSHTGTSFRIGSISHLYRSGLSVTHAAVFAGHDLRHVCAVWEYVLAGDYMTACSARCVASSDNPRENGVAPKPVFLDGMGEDERHYVLRFFFKVCNYHGDEFKGGGTKAVGIHYEKYCDLRHVLS